MPYLINSIAGFKFIAMYGEWDVNSQMLVVDSRPGVDSMEFTLIGDKGNPFSLTTIVDVNDIRAGHPLVFNYKQLIEQDPVQITKNGVPLLGSKVKVLAVTLLRLAKISTAVGNKISALSGAMLECRWDLVCVPNQQ